MIPRVKVNYGWRDLWQALWTPENSAPVLRSKLAQRLADHLANPSILLTPSGRAGLYYLLRALPQRQVIVPAYTCKAVVEAARLADKEVLFLEAEPGGFNADADQLTPLLGPDVVLIATHQFGIPCDILRLTRLCQDTGTFLIEDVAAAFGTRIGGRLAGTFGDAAFFSFDSTKLINVPLKSGFITTRDPALLAKVRAGYEQDIQPMPATHKLRLLALGAIYLLLELPFLYDIYHRLALRRQFTADTSELHLKLTEFYRFDMMEWQAAIALPQVERLDALVARRRQLYAAFRETLAGCAHFILPPADIENAWACIRFPILVGGDKLAWYRAAYTRGVDFAFSFTFLASPPHFTRAHALARAILDLPFYDKLSTKELARVADTLRAIDAAPPTT